MMQEPSLVQCPEPVETASLHFKACSKLQLFKCDQKLYDGRTSLLAVSNHHGLVFVGTVTGLTVLKSNEIFSESNPTSYHYKEILLSAKTTHLAVDCGGKHLAVGCQTAQGCVIFIYNIVGMIKGGSPIKTIPVGKSNAGVDGGQAGLPLINELMWQPNNENCLVACLSNGSVVAVNIFQGTGSEFFLPPTSQATCACWSPKGKQIVVGHSDGTLTQHKPDLSLVKKLSAAPLYQGAVTVVNVLWISSFQFAVAYRDANKQEEFPVIVIVNSPKNEPINFINYDDITYSTIHYRSHQLYFLHHLSQWGLILVSSANSIELAVLHAKEDNTTWEQWLLGDASRAELPLNSERAETFPLGLSFDFSSNTPIPWGEDSLWPIPRLLLISTEGLLITFNIVNLTSGAPRLWMPVQEPLEDVYFSMKSDTHSSDLPTESAKTGGAVTPPTSFLPQLKLTESSESVNASPGGFAGFGGSSSAAVGVHSTAGNTTALVPNKVVSSFETPSTDNSAETAFSRSKPLTQTVTQVKIGVSSKESTGLKKSDLPDTGPTPESPASDSAKTLSSTDPKKEETPKTSPNRSAPELAKVDESVYLTALADEIEHFNSELKEVISRLSDLKVKIGTEEDKSQIRNMIEELKEFQKELRETTASQRNEIHTVKTDVIETFAWLEDAKSRNRQRKSQPFIQLKKSEELDAVSSKLMNEINHLKYYIENQFTQLFAYLDKACMIHEDNCRADVKSAMKYPSMEELYKTMSLQLKILSRQKILVKDLKRRKLENKRLRKTNEIVPQFGLVDAQFSTNDYNKASELSKLADNLLQLKIEGEDGTRRLTSSDAAVMIRNEINWISERRMRFTPDKQNKLRDLLSEREMIKTRTTPKSNFGTSAFIRNLLIRACEKRAEQEKKEKLKSQAAACVSAGEEKAVKETTPTLAKISEESEKKKEVTSTVTKAPIATAALTTLAPTVPAVSFITTSATVKPSATTASAVDRKPSKPVFSFSPPKLSTTQETNSEKPGIATFSFSKSNESPLGKPAANVQTWPTAFKSTIPEVAPIVTASPKSFIATTAASSFSVTPPSFPQSSMFGKSTSSIQDKSSSIFPVKSTESGQISASTFSFVSPELSNSKKPETSTNVSAAVNVKDATPISTKPSTSVAASSVFSMGSGSASSSIATSTVPSLAFSSTPTSSAAFTFTTPFGFSNTVNNSSVSVFGSPAVMSAQKTNLTLTSGGVNIFGVKNTTPAAGKIEASPIQAPATPPAEQTSTVFPQSLKKSEDIPVSSPVVISLVGSASSTGETKKPIVPTSESLKADVASKKEGENKPDGEKKIQETPVQSAFSGTVAGLAEAVSVAKTVPTQPTFVQPAGIGTAAQSVASSGIFGSATQQNAPAVVSFGTAAVAPNGQTAATTAPKLEIFQSQTFQTKEQTTGSSSLFKTASPTTSSNIFSSPTSTVVSSTNIFGNASPSTSSVPKFGQPEKDGVVQATDLFGQVLGSGMSSRDAYGNRTTTASENIFGDSAFKSSGSTNIFGKPNATSSASTATTSFFSTNSSNNIFSQASSSFGQSSASGSASVFGGPPPATKSNSFFGQNMPVSYGASNSGNIFSGGSGFESKPVFGQSLFAQNNTGQNLLQTSSSSSTSIFGGSSPSTSSSVNIFQTSGSTFASSPPGPFSGSQNTTGQSGFGSPSTFQKPLGGFGGSPVFGSGLATTATFGAPPTFGGAPTFGSPPSFGNHQKPFGSPQGTFGQNLTQSSNLNAPSSQGADGFANLAQQSKNQGFGGSAFPTTPNFKSSSTFGSDAFSGWRS